MSFGGAAPVAVFAFNRPQTTRITLDALANCEGFNGRCIYLFCDGPRESRPDDKAAVAEVRQVLQSWAAGRRAECLFSSINQGLRPSIIAGVSEILQRHGQIIVLEDDIVVAPGFLRFMQQSLDAFQHSPGVWQVSGYMTPHRRRSLSPGFLRLPSCWGWGTWQDRWQHFNDDAATLLMQIRKCDISRFNMGDTYDYLDDLKLNAEGRLNTWHVRWYASMFLQNALAYYPGRTLTRNIGFDGNGTHCGPSAMTAIFQSQVLGECPPAPLGSGNIQESSDLLREMQTFYRYQQRVWSGVTWRQRLRAKAVALLRRIHGSRK